MNAPYTDRLDADGNAWYQDTMTDHLCLQCCQPIKPGEVALVSTGGSYHLHPACWEAFLADQRADNT